MVDVVVCYGCYDGEQLGLLYLKEIWFYLFLKCYIVFVLCCIGYLSGC